MTSSPATLPAAWKHWSTIVHLREHYALTQAPPVSRYVWLGIGTKGFWSFSIFQKMLICAVPYKMHK